MISSALEPLCTTMDAPESPPTDNERGYTFRTRGSKKRRAETNVALETGGSSVRRPFTRSQAKEQANQQKLRRKRLERCSCCEIFQVESSAEILDGPPTHRENEENYVVSEGEVKVLVPPSAGVPLRRCSSADTLILINSWTQNSGCLSTGTEPLNTDDCVTSNLNVEGANEVTRTNEIIGTSKEHHLPKFRGNSYDLWNSSPSSIISKHGEITKFISEFQSQLFKSTCVEIVYKAVKKLQETKLADVNSDPLKEFHSFIEGAKRINLEVKWLQKYVDEAAEAMKSTSELQRLEEAERELGKENEDKQKAIRAKKVHAAQVQSEIAIEEEELALAIQKHKELKERISRVKSGY